MVYVGANDGMLHAFHADDDAENGIKGGDEAWAYILRWSFPGSTSSRTRIIPAITNSWSMARR
jgi:hypothetical protein